jgi:FkbH-like protein
MVDMIEPRLFRAPEDLAVTPLAPRRVLIVGSCLSTVWARRIARGSPACDSDSYLLGQDLPANPARPIGDYDFQLVQLPLRVTLPDTRFARLSQTDLDGHRKAFERAEINMRRLLTDAMRWNREHGLLTFVFPFIVPQQNPMGRLMPRYDLRNAVYFVEKLNETLARELQAYSNAYLFDFNEVASVYGRRFVQEDAFAPFNHNGFISNNDVQVDSGRLEPVARLTDYVEERIGEIVAAAWHELLSMYRTIRQTDMVKMVVIDLDDTLWRGVIAERDPDELPTTEGWPKAFWEALLFLKRRGVLLGIISKNEESRVVEVWDRLLRRGLKLDDFAIRRINWQPKPENMAAILAQVNLLPRNVVYIDDNPAERAAIKGAFPEIRVLGGNPVLWRRILLWSAETQVPDVTAESAARTEMVRAQVVREVQREAMSREEFLASLNVEMKLFQVDSVSHPRFPRVLELINKTNQFNTTGERWTIEQCGAALASGTAFFAFEVADIYTDYGLVGVLVVEDDTIGQFVMSCRIMGLGAEVAGIAHVMATLRGRGAVRVSGVMVETARNLPCRDLYARCGFTNDGGRWWRDLDPPLPVPGHIKLALAGG